MKEISNIQLECLYIIVGFLPYDSQQWSYLRIVCKQWYVQSKTPRWLKFFEPHCLDQRSIFQLSRHLPNLQNLILKGCDISDIIVQTAVSFTALRKLDLSHSNHFTNEHLQVLVSLSGLRELNLTDCGAVTESGFLALTALTELEVLDLNGCKIVDSTLETLALSLPRLHHLELLRCQKITVSGIQALLCSNQALLHLVLSTIDNACVELLPLSLQYLRLAANQMTNMNVQALSRLSALRCLGLKNVQISDDCLAVFSNFPQLSQLDLPQCRSITDKAISSFTGLRNLQSLNLSLTLVTNRGVKALTVLTGLRDLLLSHTAVSDAGVYSIIHMLRTLNLNNTSVTGKFCGSSMLQRLHLGKCDIDIDHFSSVSLLTNLRFLSVKESSITDEHLKFIGLLTQLVDLNLRSCELISDAGIEELKPLVALSSLCLAYCQRITDQALKVVFRLPKLRNLLLAGSMVSDIGMQFLTLPRTPIFLNLSCTLITKECLQSLNLMQNVRAVI